MFQGLSCLLVTSALQQACRTQVQHSLRQRSRVTCAGAACVCADCHVHLRYFLLMSATLGDFPKMSTTFCTFLRDGETTIKIEIRECLQEGGHRGQRENCSKTLFFMVNTMTMKFRKCRIDSRKISVVIMQAPTFFGAVDW